MENKELENKILKEFYDLQCNEDNGLFNDDETPLVSYSRLEKSLGIERKLIKPHLIELRNNQVIELTNAVDGDYVFAGRGWMLTEKGAKLVQSLFFIPDLI